MWIVWKHGVLIMIKMIISGMIMKIMKMIIKYDGNDEDDYKWYDNENYEDDYKWYDNENYADDYEIWWNHLHHDQHTILSHDPHRQLRTRRALMLFNDVPLRTRRALMLRLFTALTPFWFSTDEINNHTLEVPTTDKFFYDNTTI